MSFTDKRRARLARKFARLDQLEVKSTITEPISVLGLSMSAYAGLVRLGIMSPSMAAGVTVGSVRAGQSDRSAAQAPSRPTNFVPIEIGRPIKPRQGPAGGSSANSPAANPAPGGPASNDWLTVDALTEPASSDPGGISSPWHPVTRAGGGAAMAPRGGSGNGALPVTLALVHGQVAPLHLPAPQQSSPSAAGGSSSGALLAAVASSMNAGGTNPAPEMSAALPGGTSSRLARATPGAPATPPANHQPGGITASPDTGSGGTSFGSIPGPSVGGNAPLNFPYYPLYVLDNNDGVVLFPGVTQLAEPYAYVDLEAQVSGTTVSSYNWNTSGISSDAGSIAGTTTYDLTFQWDRTFATSHTDSITLSVTDV
jgi:hypothetical protein